jgi:predicted phosphodiesterase
MRVALIADIHGNLPALIAVMAELERLQPDAVILNGDLINAVPFSAEVIDVVRRTDWTVIRGNHEFYYLDFGTDRVQDGYGDRTRWGQLHWLIERISPAQGAYLGMLPDDCTVYLPGCQPMRVAHGVPGRNRVGFFNEQAATTIAAELKDVRERTVLSAHTHVQVDRHVWLEVEAAADLYADPHSGAAPGMREQHWHVINPGSVGLPVNGDVQAQFALLENVPEHVQPGGWQATMVRVPYDRRPALEAFHTTGMLAAGGAISEMFYWEVVTAEPEILIFYRWARVNHLDADTDIAAAFAAYKRQTERVAYVRAHDPLLGGKRSRTPTTRSTRAT